MSDVKILYTGLDTQTFSILRSVPRVTVAGVSYIPNLSNRTYNPINYIFKGIYTLRYVDKFRVVELFLLCIWILVWPLSTNIFRRYATYLIIVSRYKLQIIDVYDPLSREIIQSNTYDLMVVNAWGILPKEVIYAPQKGTINIHPSKLPQYQGALPTLWSLKNGDTESAVTYIILTEEQDAGDIIGQHAFPIEERDDWFTLEEKIAKIIKNTLSEDITRFFSGACIPRKQDLTKSSKTARYEAYREIMFENERAIDIYNKVYLYPHLEHNTFCYFIYKGREISVFGCVHESINNYTRQCAGDRLTFTTRDGTISLRLFRDIGFWDSIFLIKRFE